MNKVFAVKSLKLFSLALVAILGFGAKPAQAAVAKATFVLQWDLPTVTTGITEYRIYLRTASGSYPSTTNYKVTGNTGTSLTISDVDPGSYYFRATSWNGTAESSPSNEVIATALPISLQGITDNTKIAGAVFSAKLFSVGGTTALLSLNATANSTGVITLPHGGAAIPTSFDVLLKTSNYLALRSSKSLSAITTVGPLLGGNINQADSIVNSSDDGQLIANFGTNVSVGDINRDGIVNSADRSILLSNWFQQDNS